MLWAQTNHPEGGPPLHAIDLALIGIYLLATLAVGLFFLRRQERVDEYFVGDRRMGAGHIGFSVVATDVGGGFSIGLGGLGFAMGLSGSWLLFTGLVGAWMAAVILIPRVKALGDKYGWLTFPDFLEHRFDGRTRLAAAVVSAIGYAGFVGAQLLAGAKLGAVAFEVDVTTAVFVMAAVVLLYTAFGGMQAVVFTDTIQWAVLLGGLILVALPAAYFHVGGLDGLAAALPPEHLTLTNVTGKELLTWAITIIPIWFVGMTLYQRIYATRDVQTAKRAFYLAGLLEYPLMAFTGTALGMMARVVFPAAEPELGLPMLIKEVLPVGAVGIVMAAYFSAIMSTADSCLLASVGNCVNDLYQRYLRPNASARQVLRLSRILTLVIGALSVAVALLLPMVLDAILLAYSFMVSGLFVPTLAGLLWKRATAEAAFWSTIGGGFSAVALGLFPALDPFGEPVLTAMPVSAVLLVSLSLLRPEPEALAETAPYSG